MNYARQIAQDTLAWFPEMHRAFPEWVDRSIAETRAFDDWTAVPVPTRTPAVLPIDVRVVARDTIDAALDLGREGLHPLVLNMASERVPGGGWLKGSQA